MKTRPSPNPPRPGTCSAQPARRRSSLSNSSRLGCGVPTPSSASRVALLRDRCSLPRRGPPLLGYFGETFRVAKGTRTSLPASGEGGPQARRGGYFGETPHTVLWPPDRRSLWLYPVLWRFAAGRRFVAIPVFAAFFFAILRDGEL